MLNVLIIYRLKAKLSKNYLCTVSTSTVQHEQHGPEYNKRRKGPRGGHVGHPEAEGPVRQLINDVPQEVQLGHAGLHNKYMTQHREVKTIV